jgi:hypothetical protein
LSQLLRVAESIHCDHCILPTSSTTRRPADSDPAQQAWHKVLADVNTDRWSGANAATSETGDEFFVYVR